MCRRRRTHDLRGHAYSAGGWATSLRSRSTSWRELVAPKRVLLRLGLAVALVLVMAATVLAAGTLDQQSTTSNNAHAVAGTIEPPGAHSRDHR